VSRRQLSEPVQWLIIIGLVLAAWAVALGLLAIGRIAIVAVWAVWG
jgi:hypothetical protein